MLEMLVTVIAAIAAALFALSKFLFVAGEEIEWYCLGILILILFIYFCFQFFKAMRRSHIRDLNLDEHDYRYYNKYTSPLYHIGYFISYLVQNILFDYTYMRRNFNFCKGLDVYDGGVGEYYIKFRNTWYRYLALTIKRHNVSLKKLQAFANSTKNDMIIQGISSEEEKEIYLTFQKEASDYYNQNKKMTKPIIKTFSNYKKLDSYYRKNTLKYYKALMYIEKHEPDIIDLVKRLEHRSNDDINRFKKMNFR